MIERDLIQQLSLVDEVPEASSHNRPVVLAEVLRHFEELANAEIFDEQRAGLDEDDVEFPPPVNADGATFVAARLERERGTSRFTVILLTEADL